MIVYVIGNFKGYNSGNGGHYYSLLYTSQSMQRYLPTIIYSIGHSIPVPFLGSNSVVHISARIPARSVANDIKADLKTRGLLDKVDIVHGFDYNSSITANGLARDLGVPFAFTKCGGSPIGPLHPIFPNTIVYHEKDRLAFQARGAHRDRIQLIPNRVKKVQYDRGRAEAAFGPKEIFTIFRIGRIGSAYERSISQSIELVAELNKHGLRCRLEVIGYVEKQEVLDRLVGQVAMHEV